MLLQQLLWCGVKPFASSFAFLLICCVYFHIEIPITSHHGGQYHVHYVSFQSRKASVGNLVSLVILIVIVCE